MRETEEDTCYWVLQAQVSLNKYNAIWKSDLKLRQKIQFLKSRVFPSLVNAAECGNHIQLELGLLDMFIKECRRNLLKVCRLAAEGNVITNEEPSRGCRLPSPLDLLAWRWINLSPNWSSSWLAWQPGICSSQRLTTSSEGIGVLAEGNRVPSSKF
jgi:hypothetical protein